MMLTRNSYRQRLMLIRDTFMDLFILGLSDTPVIAQKNNLVLFVFFFFAEYQNFELEIKIRVL